jgi:DUF1365 family protein
MTTAAIASASEQGLPATLIEGEIMHARVRPTRNAFVYRAFCLRVPLSSLASLPAAGIARNTTALLALNDRDHGPRDGSALEPWIRRLLDREDVRAEGEIVLYTFPRMLGYVFNPVSFWVCHARDGSVHAVLAQVTNTFGEHHDYLLAHADGAPIVNGEPMEALKTFHVSPFCSVTGRYRFRFHFGAERWLARIDYLVDGSAQPLLATSISGRSHPLNARSARRLLFRYRWFTVGVIARIHWQALKLWLKRVPFVPKPAPPLTRLSR